MKYYAIQQELSSEEIAQKLSVAEEMLKEIKRRKPFTNERQLADEEEHAAEDCEFWICFPFTQMLICNRLRLGSLGHNAEVHAGQLGW